MASVFVLFHIPVDDIQIIYSTAKYIYIFYLDDIYIDLPAFYLFIYFLFVVDFVIHWNETAMGLHVFPIPIPPPTSLSTRSL